MLPVKRIFTYLLRAGGQSRKISRLSGRLDPYMRPIQESEPGRPYLLQMLLRSASRSRSQQPIVISFTDPRSRYPSSRVTEEQSACCCVYLLVRPAGIVSSGFTLREKSVRAAPPTCAVFRGLQAGFSQMKVPQARSTRANTNAVLEVPPSHSQCTKVVPWCSTWNSWFGKKLITWARDIW